MRDTRYEVRAVLFDLGETLLNFGKVNIAELFSIGARLSYDFLKGLGQPLSSFSRYRRRNLITIRLHYLLSNIIGRDLDSMKLLKKIHTKNGVRLDEKQWQQLAWLWYEPLSKQAQVEPNIVETLTALEGLGLKLGIVSNTFISAGSLDRHLQQFGILKFFPVRLYSCQFAYKKPDIRIFRAAAEKIGEPAENIVFVGDRINKDIKPAIKAGMRAVLKTAYTNTAMRPPNGVRKINRLAELPRLIEKINNHATVTCKQPIANDRGFLFQ